MAVSLFSLLFSEGSSTDGNRVARELFSLFLLFWGLFLLLSLGSYSQLDPSLNHVVSSPVTIHNAAGVFGAYLAGMLVDFFGIASYLWAMGFVFAGGRNFIRGLEALWWRWLGIVLFGISLCALASAVGMQVGDIAGGGLLGNQLYSVGWYYLRPIGATLLWLFVTICSIQLSIGISWAEVAGFLRRAFAEWLERRKADSLRNARRERDGSSGVVVSAPSFSASAEEEVSRKRRVITEGGVRKAFGALCAFFRPRKRAEQAGLLVLAEDVTPVDTPQSRAITGMARSSSREVPVLLPQNESFQADSGLVIDEPVTAHGGELLAPFPETPTAPPRAAAKRPAPPKVKTGGKVRMPPLDLLSDHTGDSNRTPRDVLEDKGRLLIECLADFGVQGELQRITPGPVVTMFEIKPAPGVKVSRIANLSDDLAMALRAISVRIQAPIPGKDSVGIEIPNDVREMVCLRELLSADVFRKSALPLTLAIGKDISGIPFATDLAKMPHLLVAGATGQGKSVFINSVLMSLLYRTTPEELQLLLVDPKRIELAVYADMPHLVHPVVTDMSQAKNALDWAVHEMDKRYESMAVLGVRNIISYNEKLASLGNDVPEQYIGLESMPYLVIIIDELADLMLTAAKEVETSIVRLAQLARAAGIHLILATQRPSVDVVTGLIKANFPCRISFQVTAKHDSRTILDTVGAEHLLGKGDMLFKAGGGRLQRMHGAFVSDEDVVAVVDFWKTQLPPSYKVDFAEWGSEGTGDLGGYDGNGGPMGITSDDPMYAECLAFVMQQGKASISLIQRRFRIGFNRAARYVEQMEQDGIIGPADGSKPRSVVGTIPMGKDDF